MQDSLMHQLMLIKNGPAVAHTAITAKRMYGIAYVSTLSSESACQAALTEHAAFCLVVAEEWRHLAGLHADKGGVLALVLGAVVLAPLTEEFFFRGFVLPSLTKWVNPLLAVSTTHKPCSVVPVSRRKRRLVVGAGQSIQLACWFGPPIQ
jgi:hypothetical protein